MQILLPTLPRTPRCSSVMLGVSHQDTQDHHSGTRTRGITTHSSATHPLHPDTYTHPPDTLMCIPCTSPLPALTLLRLTFFPHPTSPCIPPLLLPLTSTRLSPVLSGHQTLCPSLTPLLLPPSNVHVHTNQSSCW